MPYDINWNNLRLIVNVARPSKKKSLKRSAWFFSLSEKDHVAADFFLLFCLMENKVEAIYAIPQVFSPRAYFTINNLNGSMRYNYFKANLENLAQKIIDINKNLPKLQKISQEARELGK